jgi:hypothetical protein
MNVPIPQEFLLSVNNHCCRREARKYEPLYVFDSLTQHPRTWLKCMESISAPRYQVILVLLHQTIGTKSWWNCAPQEPSKRPYLLFENQIENGCLT